MRWFIAHPRITWSLVGFLGALGALGIGFSALFVLPLMIAIVVPFWLWPRIGGRNAFFALVTLGLPACVALSVAYAQSTGCPANGARVELKKNKPPVACDEIRASYLTFATLFGVVTLIGLSGSRIARTWTEAQAHEEQLDAEYEAQLEADKGAGQVLDAPHPGP